MSEERAERSALRRWLRERLISDRARADLESALGAAWRSLLARNVGDVLPRPAVEQALRANLNPDRLAALVKPFFGPPLREIVEDLRNDRAPLGRFVPPDAQAKMESLAAQPGQVDPEWLRALFRERAIEVLLADTLYGAMREFSTALPKLILSLLPTGRLGVIGGAVGIGGRIVEEIERKIEPEIKSFLQTGTQRALQRAADFAVAHADDAPAVELRRNLIRFTLARAPSFHLKPLTAERLKEVEAIAESIARAAASSAESSQLITGALDRWEQRYGSLTVEAALLQIGAAIDPPLDKWVAVGWAAWTIAVESGAYDEPFLVLIEEGAQVLAQAAGDPALKAPAG